MRFLKYIFCALLFVTASVAETININWINGDETYAQTTCEIGGDIILPSPPTKRGYTFKGWIAGYIQLEYIESTGTQYIDTGKPYDSSNIYTVEFQYVEYPTSAKGFFGARESSMAGRGTFDIGCNISNVYFYNNDSSNTPLYAKDKNKHIYEEDFTNHITNLDGVPLSPVRTKWEAWQGTQNIYIGCENIAGTPNSNTGTIKIYSYKVSNTGGTVQYLIPAKRNSDNAIGMYDTVSKTFFTNAGTGEFIAGPVAENQNFYE